MKYEVTCGQNTKTVEAHDAAAKVLGYNHVEFVSRDAAVDGVWKTRLKGSAKLAVTIKEVSI